MNKTALLILLLLFFQRVSFAQSLQPMTVLDSARYYFEYFDFESSEELFQNIVASDSTNFSALEGLADSKINLGQKVEALTILDKLYNLDSTNSRVAGKRASLLMDFDRFNEAEAIYANLILRDTTNAYFSRKRAISVYKQDDYRRTVPLVEKYLKLQPSDNEMKMVMADSYQKIDSFASAITVCEDVLNSDSISRSALSKAGFLYFSKLKKYEKALPFYEKLNKLENYKDPFHLKNQGICEFFTGNHEHSAYLLDSLSDELNDDAMIPFYAGLSYKGLGKVDEALLFLQRSATIAVPAYLADIYHHLGRAYSQKRMFNEALESYFKVREIDATNYHVLYDIAIAYEEFERNIMAALPYYNLYVEKVVNPNPSDFKYAKDRIVKIKEQLFFEGK